MTVAMETVAEATEVAVSPATAAALEPRCLGKPKGPAILLRRPPEVAAAGFTPVGDVSGLDLIAARAARHQGASAGRRW